MIVNSHNSRGSSTRVGYQNSRWRTVLITLLLALAFGSASQPAQAAPARELANFSMKFEGKPKTSLKCGETVTYLVKVELQKSGPMPLPTPDPQILGARKGVGVIGIDVEAFSVDKAVGDFVGKTTVRTTVVFDDDLASFAAKFKFKANKPGKTTLYFEGLVGKEYVTAKLDVKVIPCKFKVKTLLQFPVEIYDITVISDNAVMTADEAGTFTGSTSMYWAYSNFNLAPCTIEIGATDSQVDLTGQVDEDGGQFTATQTFQPQTAGGIVSCPGGIGGGSGAFTVAPLTFSVASTGGVSIQTVTAEGVSGLAHIVVTPEEDEAVSFIPVDHEVGWNDFSNLFGILLALH